MILRQTTPTPMASTWAKFSRISTSSTSNPSTSSLAPPTPPAADPTFVKVLNGVRAEGLKRLWEAELQGPRTPAWSARLLGGLNPPSRAVFFGPEPPTLDALLALPTVHGCRRWGSIS